MRNYNVKEQQKKLEQKKNRLAAEETRLKLKERKARTRHLIEHGGLIAKAGLDYLPANALYGALLSLKESFNADNEIIATWVSKGDAAFTQEQQQTIPVILTFKAQPDKELRNQIRTLGMRWNKFRSEWYGSVENIDGLTKLIADQPHNIEILK